MSTLQAKMSSTAAQDAIATADAHLSNAGLLPYSRALAALEQIERLAREGTYEGQIIRESIREIAAKALGR